jgi:hypothetical protein
MVAAQRIRRRPEDRRAIAASCCETWRWPTLIEGDSPEMLWTGGLLSA